MMYVRFYCIYWRYRCAEMQVVTDYTVYLMMLLLIAQLV